MKQKGLLLLTLDTRLLWFFLGELGWFLDIGLLGESWWILAWEVEIYLFDYGVVDFLNLAVVVLESLHLVGDTFKHSLLVFRGMRGWLRIGVGGWLSRGLVFIGWDDLDLDLSLVWLNNILLWVRLLCIFFERRSVGQLTSILKTKRDFGWIG